MAEIEKYCSGVDPVLRIKGSIAALRFIIRESNFENSRSVLRSIAGTLGEREKGLFGIITQI